MAKQPRLTNLCVNTMADANSPLLNNGFLRIYDGTQPATGDTAITTQVLLAELRWNAATAFAAASAGVAVANAITGDASANNSGTASWFRALKSDGTTAVFDGSVGTSNADLIMSSVTITAGQVVNVTAFQYILPKA
jgi:hypothetical protein